MCSEDIEELSSRIRHVTYALNLNVRLSQAGCDLWQDSGLQRCFDGAQHLESESWLGSLLIVTAGASVEPKRRWDAVSFSANRHV